MLQICKIINHPSNHPTPTLYPYSICPAGIILTVLAIKVTTQGWRIGGGWAVDFQSVGGGGSTTSSSGFLARQAEFQKVEFNLTNI